MWPFRRRQAPALEMEVDLTVGSLSAEAQQGLEAWRDQVTQGDGSAIDVLNHIAEYYVDDWTKFFGILMDLDREGIHGAAVAELFTQCEGDIPRFKQRIA